MAGFVGFHTLAKKNEFVISLNARHGNIEFAPKTVPVIWEIRIAETFGSFDKVRSHLEVFKFLN
jgi:hypothetical protein